MKQKYTRKRLDILYNYRDAIIRFGWINLFATVLGLFFFLVMQDNPYDINGIALISTGIIFFMAFALLLFKSFNRNILLWMASLFVCVYAISFNYLIAFVIEGLVFFSLFYEIIMRFALGIYIDFIPKEYLWSFQRTQTKSKTNLEDQE